MDFFTGIAEIESNTYDEPPPKNRWEAFWQWLVSDRFESFCMRPLIAFFIDVRGRCLRYDQLHSSIQLHCFFLSEPCPILAIDLITRTRHT
jgi:hypothetical protein